MIRINLLPIRAEKRKENLRKHLFLAAGNIVVAALVIASLHFSIVSRIDDQQEKISGQEKEIVVLDQKIKEVEGYNQKLKDLTEKVNLIAALEQRQRGPTRMFLELARISPEKLWIEKLQDKGGTITIEGYAIDQQTIAAFMTNLENSEAFEKVRLKLTQKQEKGGVSLQNFSLETQVVLPKVIPTGTATGSGKAG
jgi:type IV pilus assembly protein PilN